jgi:hypothetical protein
MHWILGAVLHATVLGIVAFFILFAASKAEGLVALLGRILGLWVLLIALLALAGGITAAMNGGKPFGMDIMHGPGGPGWMMHGENGPGWMHRWGPPDGRWMQPPPPQNAPAPAKP